MVRFPLLQMMKLIFALSLIPYFLFGQLSQGGGSAINRLATGSSLPEKILSARSVVLYSPGITPQEINDIHESLTRTGIDAVAYFAIDKVFAGPDVELAFYQYFTTREIGCFVIVQKTTSSYQVIVTAFSGKVEILHQDQPAWSVENQSLKESLRILYSTALNTYKKQNLLISDKPETDLVVNVIVGRRTEAFATDLKVDRLAVQKFGDDELDRELEEIMKMYPFKYGLVDKNIPEADLRKQGYFYILRSVCSRGPTAKEVLGYTVSRVETAVASITYPEGVEQVKTIPSNIPVYKYYARQIEFNNVFLGSKWDADTSWQQALKNFIFGFRKAMMVN